MRELLARSPADRPGPFHLAALANMGNALQTRFKVGGDAQDLTQAIDNLGAALEICTPESPYYVPIAINLTLNLRTRYSHLGDIADLDRVSKLCPVVLTACPAGNPHRDSLLNNFANNLRDQFEVRGDRRDLELAFAYYKECLNLRPPGHPRRLVILTNLGITTHLRFELDGQSNDFEEAAGYFIAALQLSPSGDGCLPLFNGLGAVYCASFVLQGDIRKLEMAIECYDSGLASSSKVNLDRSHLLDNYAFALRARYTSMGDVSDVDLAIQHCTTSLAIQHPTYPRRPLTLLGLGTALLMRFNTMGSYADLESSIERLAEALQLCGPGQHSHNPILLVYSDALVARFKQKGDVRNLHTAIAHCKEGLASCPPSHATYPAIVVTYASVLLDRFRHLKDDVDDLQVVIDLCDKVMGSVPDGHASLHLKVCRADAYLERFQHEGREADLDMAITLYRDAMQKIPEGDAEFVPVHIQLGIALDLCFNLKGKPEDVDEAIQHLRSAHRVCKRGDSSYIALLQQFGNALRSKFEILNDIDSLDEAIIRLAEAEEILSSAPGNTDHALTMSNLAIAVFMRFQIQHSSADLDMAIGHMSAVCDLPAQRERALNLFALATMLSTRFDQDKDLNDLEQSINRLEAASNMLPPTHPVRITLSRNHGRALFKLARHGKALRNLDDAIARYEESLALTPKDHPDLWLTTMWLAQALGLRAMSRFNDEDLYRATALLQVSMQALSEGHRDLCGVYQTMANVEINKYKHSHEACFMEEGFRLYALAAQYSHGRSFQSVSAALEWTAFAEELGHPSALEAYRTSLHSLDLHVLSTPSVMQRHGLLQDRDFASEITSLASDATACAIGAGNAKLAIELSEEGRGLLWSQMARIRTPLDSLRSIDDVGRDLASEFERISSQLSRSSIDDPTKQRGSRLSLEEDARKYHQLSAEWDAIVERIRAKPGFEAFLHSMRFQDLREAAAGGPVIIINVSKKRCDAIIILRDQPPRLVPLPKATVSSVATLSDDFYKMLKRTSYVGEEKARDRQLEQILRRLWDMVVCPIVDQLTGFLPPGSRIWWCPTSKLTSLPLHAAGPYRTGAKNLAKIYISSYTPTLSALIRSRRQTASRSAAVPRSFLAIGQGQPGPSTGQNELKCVDAELDLVKSLVLPSMTCDSLSGENGTADAVLTGLQTHAWVHLACHGRQDAHQPFNSSFALRDRSLTLLDIVRAELANPEFAFLSACHTAVGDKNTPDEVVHLAAGIQFSGFGSVIGTMWAVDDATVQRMVREFYTHMLSGGVVDCTNAARALNRASKTVDKDAVPMDQRVVFIHIGA
ncbi:CHAT domain-containing protein [Phlebopus sp. FC_14]|nr:CHAT domain-containing protein [Phlebopus sp. FC_14]